MKLLQPALVAHARETIGNLQNYEGDKWFISKSKLIFRAVIAGGVAGAVSYRKLQNLSLIPGLVVAGITYGLEYARAVRGVRKLFVEAYCYEQSIPVGVMQYVAQDMMAVQQLLNINVNMYKLDASQECLLQHAVRGENRGIARAVSMEHNYHLTSDQIVALWTSVRDRVIARALNDAYGFLINRENSQGKTALLCALEKYIEDPTADAKKSVLLLLEHGAEVPQATTKVTVKGETKELSEWLEHDVTIVLALESAQRQGPFDPCDCNFAWERKKVVLRTALVAAPLISFIATLFCKTKKIAFDPKKIALLTIFYGLIDWLWTRNTLWKSAFLGLNTPLPTASVMDEIASHWAESYVDGKYHVTRVDHEGRSLFDRLLEGKLKIGKPFQFIDLLFEQSPPDLLAIYGRKVLAAKNSSFFTYMLTKPGKKLSIIEFSQAEVALLPQSPIHNRKA